MRAFPFEDIMTFSPNAVTVWADGPALDPYEPQKSDIRAWGTAVENAISALASGSGTIAKDTRVNLYADLAHDADTMAWVYADTTTAYNGIYRKSGASGAGSWSLILPLPYSFIIASDVGVGTPNAIQATTSIPVSASALVWVTLADTTTASPVTIQFNSDSLLTIKTNTGNDPVVGGLTAGMTILGIKSGTTFRLLNDQVSSAIVAAAEDAADRAEAAAAGVNLPSLTAGADGRLLVAKGDGSGYEIKIPTYAPDPSDTSVQRELYDKLRERVSVVDFRLVIDANWTVTFDRAIDYLKSKGGGRLYVPAGTYDMGNELVIKPVLYFHNLIIEGDGPGATILDFGNAPAGTDGLCIEKNTAIHGRIGLSGFSILNSKGVGLYLNRNGGVSFLSQYFVENVTCGYSTGEGCHWYNTYQGSHVGVVMHSGDGTGAVFTGFHTSLSFTRCWTGGDEGGNALAGWDISNVTYSAFYQCASDGNGLMGWRFRNLYGLKLAACGSESNGNDGFTVDTSTGPVSISLDSVVAANNSSAVVNGYASLLGVVTGGGNKAVIDLVLPTRVRKDPGDTDIVVNGASGSVDLSYDDPQGIMRISRSGTYRLKNRAVVGRSLIGSLSASQSVVNNATAVLNIATASVNTLEGSLSGGAIVLPAGVNRIKMSAGVLWDDNSTGARYAEVNLNGAVVPGLPAQKTTGNGFTAVSLQSPVIETNPAGGDTIGANVFQNSGVALNALASGRTFLAVEAVG
jgi:hypothetical protein